MQIASLVCIKSNFDLAYYIPEFYFYAPNKRLTLAFNNKSLRQINHLNSYAYEDKVLRIIFATFHGSPTCLSLRKLFSSCRLGNFSEEHR